MSLDIDWAAVTGGEDGAALAETVRSFIHDKFQDIPLPRFIKAVEVHGFDFGQVPPEVEVKDICDPLDDFYEDDEEEEQGEDSVDDAGQGHDFKSPQPGHLQPVHDLERGRAEAGPHATAGQHQAFSPGVHGAQEPSRSHSRMTHTHYDHAHHAMLPPPPPRGSAAYAEANTGPGPMIDHFRNMPGLRSSTPTPGIPGGTSSLSYFHLPLTAGLSGTTTPLAAVAGAHFPHNWPDPNSDAGRAQWQRQRHEGYTSERAAAASINSLTPPSTADSSLRPESQHLHGAEGHAGLQASPPRHSKLSGREDDGNANLSMLDRMYADVSHDGPQQRGTTTNNKNNVRGASAEDAQVVARVTYKGNVKLSLTAEILLDYPTESFVGIPLQLTITGLAFDGIAILAYIQRRAHFCFLSPEDAGLFIEPEPGESAGGSRVDSSEPGAAAEHQQQKQQRQQQQPRGPDQRPTKVGGLLQELHVESEIGERGGGKQVLKNVGKVEKFILDQVRRIFEDEFVYPSFWTFLV